MDEALVTIGSFGGQPILRQPRDELRCNLDRIHHLALCKSWVGVEAMKSGGYRIG